MTRKRTRWRGPISRCGRGVSSSCRPRFGLSLVIRARISTSHMWHLPRMKPAIQYVRRMAWRAWLSRTRRCTSVEPSLTAVSFQKHVYLANFGRQRAGRASSAHLEPTETCPLRPLPASTALPIRHPCRGQRNASRHARPERPSTPRTLAVSQSQRACSMMLRPTTSLSTSTPRKFLWSMILGV